MDEGNVELKALVTDDGAKEQQVAGMSATGSTSTCKIPRRVLLLVLAGLVALITLLTLQPTRKPGDQLNNSVLYRHPSTIDDDNTTGELVELNPTSVWHEDIISIHHTPLHSKIVVTFAPNARCPRPYLIGRLSGPALLMITNWTFKPEQIPLDDPHSCVQMPSHTGGATNILTNCVTTMEGTYQLPPKQQQQQQQQQPGSTFFIEVVGLFCQDVYYQLRQHQKQNTTQQFAKWISDDPQAKSLMQYSVTAFCPENSRHHRLTQDHATITIANNITATTTTTTTISNTPLGFWTGTSPLPLHTRWQSTKCFFDRREGQSISPSCYEQVNTERYKPYSFEWNTNKHTQQQQKTTLPLELSAAFQQLPQQRQSSSKEVICFVGASHSGDYYKSAVGLGFKPMGYAPFYGKNEMKNLAKKRKTINPHNLGAGMVGASYPANVTPHLLQTEGVEQQGCNRFVIANGQWPGSFDHGHPDSLWKYYKDVKKMIASLQHWIVDQDHDDVRFYLRSIHYNPLGNPIQSCPPTDWRNPMVIDGYNAVLKQVAQEMHVPFLDTNRWISGPLWDSAPDWCHLSEWVQEVETVFVATSILLPSLSN
ncbi:expressed unknown protein [Seminavis robusta]|uniref:Uncharacterized protein n=1 Tax=Seminavis robusta TaxID=568900 RepID=A0A9N8EU04_9STRA|nr:expressed unknown protein [Seminavis robusta]|eukprot:Sro1568_g283020.1 n/a (594) ;mRNA; f:3400-5181